MQTKEAEGPLPPLSLRLCGHEHSKKPASEEAGFASVRFDQSPLRRDQISVKLSSPSPFTSEA